MRTIWIALCSQSAHDRNVLAHARSGAITDVLLLVVRRTDAEGKI